jgi:hypothetical protein
MYTSDKELQFSNGMVVSTKILHMPWSDARLMNDRNSQGRK